MTKPSVALLLVLFAPEVLYDSGWLYVRGRCRDTVSYLEPGLDEKKKKASKH